MMKLQTAYAQTVRDHDGNKWIVYDVHGERIGELPARLNEQEAMNVLHFARNFELLSYNSGADAGLERGRQAADLRVSALKAQMHELLLENERMANILEHHMNPEGA